MSDWKPWKNSFRYLRSEHDCRRYSPGIQCSQKTRRNLPNTPWHKRRVLTNDFFAVLWDPGTPSHDQVAAQVNSALARACEHLVPVLSIEGLQFYSTNGGTTAVTVHLLAEGAGVVFGTLFRRARDNSDDAPCPRAALSANDAARIVRSGGRYLVDNYWGHYLAFLVDDIRRTKWALRSPTCHQPCLCASYRGVQLYFSTVEDCARLGLLRLTINWDFVAAFSAFARLSGAETGLNEIHELSTGECQKSARGTNCRTFYWNPAEIARLQLDDNHRESRHLLRSTVLSCVSTWAGEHTGVVHRLSGGIDSSVAAICLGLAPTRPKVICVNYYSCGTYGDERRYARAVAERTGFRLVEYKHNTVHPMDAVLMFRRTESPAACLMRDGCDYREIDLAHEVGATARFTGIMGDMLFHMPPAAPTIADYFRKHGFDRRFLETAFQAAQMDRVSVWTILWGALINGRLRPPKSFVPGDFGNPDHSLLTSEICESVFYPTPLRFVHPWLHDLREVPVGKFPLIAGLSWNSAYFNALRDPCEAELIHPFFSEPLMELCLRLPTYSMLRDGWDRALVREAFQHELPDVVRTRTSKGSANLYVKERIENNAGFIRDLLENGVLVNQGILDRKKLADCLPGRATRSATTLGHVWACVAAEAWSRAWLSQPANETG
jgi:asparagine synthase (glutamine-hydrolysing)